MNAHPTTSFARALSEIFVVAPLAAMAMLGRYLRNRRDFNRLSALSDAELKDIGLTRADLYAVATSASASDPTARLSDIVQARYRDL